MVSDNTDRNILLLIIFVLNACHLTDLVTECL